jgi:hypothetical protein
MSFPGSERLTEAREVWESYRHDDDFFAADAEERFLKRQSQTYLLLRQDDGPEVARAYVVDSFLLTGAGGDDDEDPWPCFVLADWVIHELVPRWHGPAAVAPAPVQAAVAPAVAPAPVLVNANTCGI